MGLFTISCQTCSARLVVQNESAVGQVLSCPKCSSMVEIHAPEGWEPPAKVEEASDSAAGETQAAPQIDTTAAASSRTASKPASENAPVLPTDQWTSDAVKQRRKAVALIAGIVAIAAVVLAAIGFMIAQNSKNDELADQKGSDEQEQAEQNDSTENDPGDDNNDNEPTNDETDSVDTDPETVDNGTNETTEDDAVVNSSDDSEIVANNDATENTTSENDVVENSSSNGNASEPFDIDSERNLSIDHTEEEESMLDSLNELGIFDDPPLSPDAINEVQTDTEDEAVGIGKVFIPRPDPLNRSLDAALAETVSGLKYENTTLVEFTRFLNQITSLPISLDIIAVAEGRLDPLTPVSVNETEIPVGELLSKVLGSANLGYEIVGEDQNRLILITPSGQGISKATFELPSPLVADEATLNHLVDAIQVVISAKSWNINGGQGSIEVEGDKLIVDHTASVHARVERLINLFAAAKTLKDNPKDLEAQEKVRTVYSRSRPLLTSNGSFKLLQRQPIGAVLNRVYKSDNLNVLVDWATLLPMGWNQFTEIPWPSEDNDLESTVRDVAQSMGLKCVTIDENTMAITSRQKVQFLPLIEVYPVGHLLNERLDEAKIFALFRTSISRAIPNNSDTYVYYDERYQCVVAALPEFLQIRAQNIIQQLEQVEQANKGS